MKAPHLIALVLAAASAPSQAALIAYEGFDTANAIGTDASAAGVTGTGFSAYGDTNFRFDLEAGLGYSDGSGNSLVTKGRSAGMTAEGTTSGTQNLQLTLSSTITNTGTIYMSFLMNVTAVDSFGIMTGLQDSQVTNSASPTASLEASIRSTSSNYGNYSDGEFDDRSGPTVATGAFLIVAELNMTAETMTTYLNPTNLANVPGTAAHTISSTASGTWGNMTSFIFSLGGQENGVIDEIRLGTTIGDVTPYVPEPSSVMLLGLGGLALLQRRRK